MRVYEKILRSLLFSLPPEKAHRVGEFILRRRILWELLSPLFRTADPRLNTSIGGIKLSNPVGVAAGCDKNCEFLTSLMNLGFGYVVGGTITIHHRAGNPSPRLIRYREQSAMANSLGFPSKGADQILRNLEKTNGAPRLLSVSGLTIEEFVECFRIIEPKSHGIELNISSPNTKGLQIFHEPDTFRELLNRINQVRRTPVFVKIPPYFDNDYREQVMELVVISKELGINGITATNTKPIQEPKLNVGKGGLSGKPLFADTLRIVQDVRETIGNAMSINACGGISTSAEVVQLLSAGANTVQLYTGLVYEGPSIAKRINKGLSKYLSQHELASIKRIGLVNESTNPS